MDEQIVIVDRNNKVIGSAPTLEVRGKNLLHRGSDILVFNSKGEMLITQRAKTKRVLPGYFQLGFGGAMRPGETYEDTAKRELEEESGIKGVKLEFLFSYFYEDEHTRAFPHCYKCVYDGEITPNKEVDDYFWLPIPKIKEMINKQSLTNQDIFVFKKYLEHQKSI
jgi:8-oxo-dGTP pyrophosphatase MutT (NUDIX family)